MTDNADAKVESGDLRELLLSDVFDAAAAASSEAAHGNPQRRAAIRAIFAAVEGLLALLTQQIIATVSTLKDSPLSEIDRMALLEQTFRVSDSGQLKIVPGYLPLKSRIKLVSRLVQRASPDHEVDFSSDGWQRLMQALDVRDRLTHPRARAHLDVSLEELKGAMAGLEWFVDHLIDPGHEGLARYFTSARGRLYSQSVNGSQVWGVPLPLLMSALDEDDE